MILQGRLTRSPELSTTQSGVSRCNFTVAWSEKFGDTENKLFLNCTAWRSAAEFVSNYFTKGQEIAVEGSISQRNYTGKDGAEKTAYEMPSVDRVHFCGPKRSAAAREEQAPPEEEAPAMELIPADKLPF